MKHSAEDPVQTQETEFPRVFISYSHDSVEQLSRVLSLADRLRAEGIDCHIDQYEMAPHEGWPRWMINRIETSTYVLVVCTETYNLRFAGKAPTGIGRGVKWEGAVITQEVYDAESKTTKFVPILFSPEDAKYIPIVLRGRTYYDVSNEIEYENLYRYLTNQPRITKPSLGERRPLPPLGRSASNTDSKTTDPSVSLIGILISAGGVIQSAWLNKKQQADIRLIKERLSTMENVVRSQQQDTLEDIKRYLEDLGIAIRLHGTIPSKLQPIRLWAPDLENHSYRQKNSESFLIVEDADALTLWRIDKSFLSRFLSPSAGIEKESKSYYIEEDPVFKAALVMLKQNQVDLALRLLSQLYQSNSSNADWRLLNNLAVCYLKSNKPDIALERINSATPLDPEGKAIVSFNKAVVLYELEKFSEAQANFSLALRHPLLADDALVGMLECASRITSEVNNHAEKE